MNSKHFFLGFLIFVVSAMSADLHAASWLVSAHETEREPEIIDVALNLGQPLHLTSAFQKTDELESSKILNRSARHVDIVTDFRPGG